MYVAVSDVVSFDCKWQLKDGLTKTCGSIMLLVHFIWLHDGMGYQMLALSVGVRMMTSSHGNIFRVTGHLCREFTG